MPVAHAAARQVLEMHTGWMRNASHQCPGPLDDWQCPQVDCLLQTLSRRFAHAREGEVQVVANGALGQRA